MQIHIFRTNPPPSTSTFLKLLRLWDLELYLYREIWNILN